MLYIKLYIYTYIFLNFDNIFFFNGQISYTTMHSLINVPQRDRLRIHRRLKKPQNHLKNILFAASLVCDNAQDGLINNHATWPVLENRIKTEQGFRCCCRYENVETPRQSVILSVRRVRKETVPCAQLHVPCNALRYVRAGFPPSSQTETRR